MTGSSQTSCILIEAWRVSNKISTPDKKFLPDRAGNNGDPTNKQATTFCPTAESLQSKMRPGPMPGGGRPEHPSAARLCIAAAKRRGHGNPSPLFRFEKSPRDQFAALFGRFVAFFTIFSAICRGAEWRCVSIQRIASRTAQAVKTRKHRSLFLSVAALLTLSTASMGHTSTASPNTRNNPQRPECRDTLDRVPSCFLKLGWSCSVPAP